MNPPLLGRRILVTRPEAQADRLAALIAAQGGEPLRFPLLSIAPVADPEPLRRVCAELEPFAMVIFISPNAVDYGLPLILARAAWPTGLRAVAVGQSTAARLRAFGIADVLVPRSRFDSEALLELPELQSMRVAGKKILVLRGNGGRELLAETLRQRGAEIACVSCYQRSAPVDGTPLVSLLRNNSVDALTLSSSEGLHHLWALLDTELRERLRALPVFVPHLRLFATATALGLRRVVLTAPSDAGIIDGLCAFNWSSHE